MPNRIIKETIHDSEDVNKMTDFQFRLWVNLIAYVDDYGRGDARPAIIKGKCFPLRDRLTNKDIEAALKALAGIGCVGLYEVDGKPYLYFPTWESHQRVRQKVSKYPAPPENDNLPQVAASCGELRLESNPIQSESESESESKCVKFTPPTLEEVEAYCKERNNSVDPKKFFDYYSVGNWIDSEGKPVRKWKQKIITWEKKDAQKQKKPNTLTTASEYKPPNSTIDLALLDKIKEKGL